jgi:hypothetical protein
LHPLLIANLLRLARHTIPECWRAASMAARRIVGHGFTRVGCLKRLDATRSLRPRSAFTCAIQDVLGTNPLAERTQFCISR